MVSHVYRYLLFAYSHEVRYRTRFHLNEPPPRCAHWKASEGKERWDDVELWLRQAFQAGDGAIADAPLAGIPNGVSLELDNAAADAYGNAVVPQVAEWIGRRIMESA